MDAQLIGNLLSGFAGGIIVILLEFGRSEVQAAIERRTIRTLFLQNISRHSELFDAGEEGIRSLMEWCRREEITTFSLSDFIEINCRLYDSIDKTKIYKAFRSRYGDLVAYYAAIEFLEKNGNEAIKQKFSELAYYASDHEVKRSELYSSFKDWCYRICEANIKALYAAKERGEKILQSSE